jgi:hypothetical protein
MTAMSGRRDIPAILPRLLPGEKYLMPGDPGYEQAESAEQREEGRRP